MRIKPLTKLKIDEELLLRIGGDKDEHTISWDVLKNIGDKLEQLILAIAQYTPEEVGDINNFKLHFSGFYKGSSVPAFRPNPHPILTIFDDKKAKQAVFNTFSSIMNAIDVGNYQSIADRYKTIEAKNQIIRSVYDFTNSAGNKPLSIVKRSRNQEHFVKLYSVRKLKKEVFDQLIVKEATVSDKQPEESTAVAKVIIRKSGTGRTSMKRSEIYKDKEATLSLKLDTVSFETTTYKLNFPILFQLYQEGRDVIIENEQLDLYASGKTGDAAKYALFDQFHHTYERLNSLNDLQLSSRLENVKTYFNLIIKNIRSI